MATGMLFLSSLIDLLKALSADHAVIRTNESPIEDEFEVTDTLELDTANAPIRVGVKMVNDRGLFTRLKMTTSNSPITADLELTGSKDYNEFASGRFSIEAKSTNAQVVIRHLSASVGSTVMLNAETTNAPIDVQMHPTYERSFALKTTNAKHNVDCLSRKDTNDPEGHGRSRKITLKQIQGGQLASGYVYWGEGYDGRHRGEIRMETTNKDMSLTV
ncbi:hypothetical protein BT96DRAFT_1061822 [Gymnopus androsaceus JB14]|uniref:Adhesin domain-containing protein n=1 Tax=Gymnopus androsaceus JB14 TaxID=1447944 RepID=A0A6A4H0R0_9AGAR|nr:hypothetical protein BT96DRAFT_1061822 [Gymnopus androsaceus JB14]